MHRGLVCVLLVFLAVQANATKFHDCGSTTGQVSSVEISDCPDGVDTCKLVRGTTKQIKINFQSKTESAKVKAVVHGVIEGVPLPFALPQRDGCKSGLTCPLKTGETYSYTNSLAIRDSYPALSVTVRWELKDDKSSDIVCVEMPCVIQ